MELKSGYRLMNKVTAAARSPEKALATAVPSLSESALERWAVGR